MAREATKAEKHTLIEQGTEFKGTMKSTCPVVVNGRMEGDLTAPELEVTASGAVQGNIKADRLTSRGVLSGNVDAGDLFLSGAIGSKTVIKAKNLEVKLTPEQGRMELTIGECTLDVGEEPTKERRLDPNTKLPLTSSSSGAHGYPLPVTKPSEAPTPMPVEMMESPLATAVADAKEESKSSRSGALPISKPPATSNKKLRDSVPPGA